MMNQSDDNVPDIVKDIDTYIDLGYDYDTAYDLAIADATQGDK